MDLKSELVFLLMFDEKNILNHFGLVMPYSVGDLRQHRFR